MLRLNLLLLTLLAHYRAATRSGSPKLGRSQFAYAPAGTPRSQWRYPVPSKDAARRSHLSEADRYRLHRGSLRAAASPRTKLSYAAVARASKAHGSPIASLSKAARGAAGKRTRAAAHRLAAADTASSGARHRYGTRRARTAPSRGLRSRSSGRAGTHTGLATRKRRAAR